VEPALGAGLGESFALPTPFQKRLRKSDDPRPALRATFSPREKDDCGATITGIRDRAGLALLIARCVGDGVF